MFPQVDTPAVLVDLDVAEANIDRFQAHCDAHGLKLRPHIKTHKLPMLARHQIAAGAIGITCQKISEAEAMIAEGGIADVLITYNILGDEKLARLRRLAGGVRLSVVADSRTVAEGLSAVFRDAERRDLTRGCGSTCERDRRHARAAFWRPHDLSARRARG